MVSVTARMPIEEAILEAFSKPKRPRKNAIPGLEGSCAATAGCCLNTGSASGGRPRSHSQPRSVANATPDYGAQSATLPKAGCLPGVVSPPQIWGPYQEFKKDSTGLHNRPKYSLSHSKGVPGNINASQTIPKREGKE